MGTSSNFGNVFSMAVASAFLPILPMLPTQVLLNDFLYDLAQITIPTDHVDESALRRPQRWDMRVIRDFMVFIGPISSLFDFLTFYVLLRVFHAGEATFHSGWFVESLATQTRVLFVGRDTRRPYGLPVTVLLVLLLWAPPMSARGGVSDQSAVKAPPPVIAPQRGDHAAATVPDHAVSGVVKSWRGDRLVITRAGKSPLEMTFALGPATQREGPIGIGAKVQVRFRGDGHPPLATAVLATPPPKRHGDERPGDRSSAK